MKNNNNNKKTIVQTILQYRKIIMLCLIFIVLPVICITTLYVGQYINNKPVVFVDYEYEDMSAKQLEKKFEFDLIATKYTEPTFSSDGSVSTSGSIKFDITVGNKVDSNIDSSKITVKLAACANWIGYAAEGSSETTIYFNDDSTYTIYSFNQEFPQSPLFLVNLDKEDVYIYALLSWSEKIDGSSEYEEVNVVVKFDYSDYIDKDTYFVE